MARWSPYGHFISALSTDSRELVVVDVERKTRKKIAEFSFLENPMWSADSTWIYGEMHDPRRGNAVYRVRFDGRSPNA